MIKSEILDQRRLSDDFSYWKHCSDLDLEGGVTPDYWFNSKVAKDWRFIDKDIYNPISNTDQEYLFFVNSGLFREEAAYFERYGCYTQAPEGTHAFNNYWNVQEDRCNNGYTIGGVRITGRMYFMLNFSRMRATKVDDKTGKVIEFRKKIRFPRFLDHQFYLFNELEKCMGEGVYEGIPKSSFVMAKSRRKGMTYVISSGLIVYNYTFLVSSNNILAAGETDHYKATLDAVWFTVNHLDGYTELGQNRHKKNAREHLKASYVETIGGKELECGSLSEIRFVSFKDNPFKSIGESVDFIGFEEAGKFKGLRKALRVSEPTYRDGDYYTGSAIIWGTGGDMTQGGSIDLSEIFYKPTGYGCMEYANIYDDHKTGTCGWFIDDMWYYPATIIVDGKEVQCVDSQGNSLRKYAEISLDNKRLKMQGTNDYDTFITQQPKTPSEAFMVILGTKFPAKMLNDRLNELLSDSIQIDARWVGRLAMGSDGELKFVHDPTIVPIDEYPIKAGTKVDGGIVIYYMPDKADRGLKFKNRYIAGGDPYAQDTASTSESLGSCYVFDRVTRRIVAEYVGRPDSTGDFHRQIMYLLMFYEARILYENVTPGFDDFFEKEGKLYLLAEQPRYIKRISPGSKVDRPYGCHASVPIITAYISLIKDWLLSNDTIVDEQPLMLNTILSLGLLRELMAYSKNGNFDRIVALGMVMILDKELEGLEVSMADTNVVLTKDNPWIDMMFDDNKSRDEFMTDLRNDIDNGFYML